MPTALGALDAATRREFWAGAGPSHTDGARSQSQTPLWMRSLGIRGMCGANDWREAGLEDLIREFRSENGEPARKELTGNTEPLELSCSGPTVATSALLKGLAGCADTPLYVAGT